jgi:drug/metabolite transporter (DMT)-like permease
MTQGPSKYLVFLGLLFTSTSSLFIRLIDAQPLAIAFYRLLAASMFFLAPFLIAQKKQNQKLDFSDIRLSIFSGILLAGHFGTWISSLKYTTVASSTVLVSLSPIFVAIFNFTVLKEKINRFQVIGILTALIGAIIISQGDFSLSREAFFGDFLAFSGAIFVAGYFLAGKKVRSRMQLVNYVFITYTSATLSLLLIAVLTNTNLNISSSKNLILMLLHGIVCSGFGHTTYNWMLQYISSTSVATVTLGEPVVASLLVFFVLSEIPSLQIIWGGAVVVIGLYIYLTRPNNRLEGKC